MSIRPTNSWPSAKVPRTPVDTKVMRSYHERVAQGRRELEEALRAAGASPRRVKR